MTSVNRISLPTNKGRGLGRHEGNKSGMKWLFVSKWHGRWSALEFFQLLGPKCRTVMTSVQQHVCCQPPNPPLTPAPPYPPPPSPQQVYAAMKSETVHQTAHNRRVHECYRALLIPHHSIITQFSTLQKAQNWIHFVPCISIVTPHCWTVLSLVQGYTGTNLCSRREGADFEGSIMPNKVGGGVPIG